MSANVNVPSAGEMTRHQLDDILGFAVSDEQWAAVSAPLSPAVVVAGAGSGKTTSMAARVAWLVGSGYVAPDRVLGLTFTNKATAQLLTSMRGALAKLPPRDVIDDPDDDDAIAGADPVVATYNAFTARVIVEHGIRIGVEPTARLLGEEQRHQLAYRLTCRSRLPLGIVHSRPSEVTKLLLDLDDELSNLDVRTQDLLDFDTELIAGIERMTKPTKLAQAVAETSRRRRVLTELVIEWRTDKNERDVLDFADQTRLALDLVRAHPDVALAIRESYDVVLLDEYQDTAIAQRQFMQAVFGDGHPLTAVGDPCQAIYGWRGASVDNIESFTRHFDYLRDGKQQVPARYSLSENRRSGARILALTNELSTELRAQHTGVERLVAAAEGVGPGHVRAGLFLTSAEEHAWVAAAIAEIGRSEALGAVTVLASTKRELAALDEVLRELGMATQLHGAAGLLDLPIVVEVRSLLEAVYRPVQNPAVGRLLAGARWRIGPRDLSALGHRARTLAGSNGRSDAQGIEAILREAVAGDDAVEAVSLIDAVLDPGPADAYAPDAYARIAAFGEQIRILRRHVGDPVPEIIARAVRLTGLDIEIATRSDDVARAALATLVEIAAEMAPIDGVANLGAFLSLLDDADRFEVALPVELPRRPDAVQLMTVHAAKGLEFEHVVVPGLAAGAFPGGRNRSVWIDNPAGVPWELRPDAPDHLIGFPPPDGPTGNDIKGYKALLAELRRSDDERLLYVALTRAKRSLTATGHWWGPTQSTPRGPEPYLTQIKTVCEAGGGQIVMWVDEPGEENPQVAVAKPPVPWPAAIASAPVLRDVADRVRAAMDADPQLPGLDAATVNAPGATAADADRIRRWDADIVALLERERAAHAAERTVALPAATSTSLLMRALRDPDSVALDLARPMPRQPSAAARRGTKVHLAIEQHYQVIPPIFDIDELPGSADEDLTTDEAALAAIAGFEGSPYATRQPVAIEHPFAVAVGGRLVTGTIDAVFRGDDGRFEVVDWKSGSAKYIDPTQLVVYRAAWAQMHGMDERDIDASFVMLATGEVIRPALPTLAELLGELGQ